MKTLNLKKLAGYSATAASLFPFTLQKHRSYILTLIFPLAANMLNSI